jgi:hypothetical protein
MAHYLVLNMAMDYVQKASVIYYKRVYLLVI